MALWLGFANHENCTTIKGESHDPLYLCLSLEVLDEIALGEFLSAQVSFDVGEGPTMSLRGRVILIDECVGWVPNSLQSVPLRLLVVQQLYVMEHHFGTILKHHFRISILGVEWDSDRTEIVLACEYTNPNGQRELHSFVW